MDKMVDRINPEFNRYFAIMKATLLALILTAGTCIAKYEPTWQSIDSRPLPQWFDNGKIGICAYWGIYSVPSFKSEWFWNLWRSSRAKDAVAFMKNNYRPDFTYQDFAPMLTAEFFDADKWMDIFEKAGARYVLLTSKHHEGYAMWPSKYSYSWNSVDVGPNRDIVGEFAAAVKKKKQLKFGVYYSLYEWYHPLYMEDLANNYTTDRFVKFKTMPMLYELVQNYQPELLWSDGDWMVDDFYFEPLPFLAWLYNESPVKDSVVINDRWGKNIRCKHGGYFTCHDRYDPGVLQKHKWENVMFLDKSGSGYRRVATLDSYMTMPHLLTLLTRTVSCGGNLLIDVGITADGRIPPILEERLTSLGDWLKVNGEAIYESKPWQYQNDTHNPDVWYTMKETAGPFKVQTAYAILLKWPAYGVVSLGAPVPDYDITTVELLGVEGLFPWSVRQEGGIDINVSHLPFNKMPSHYAMVFKLNGLKSSASSAKVDDDVLRFKPHH